uniref:Uncharacterized protein n=1 Tax=Dunaliella tertiolecta TaxID=3047 RepID=A0A7S3QQL4_DUNTE
MDALLGGGQLANGGEGNQSLMHAPEAERIIDQLAPMTVQDVGTAKWNAQGQNIQRLNLQAHYNAQQHAEEFVVELLVSLDKMQVLVQNLLAIEAWKEKVLPHLHRQLARNVDKVVSYMVLYHEVTLANLLEVTLYHSHAAEALPEEHLLELADWCYRKLRYLNDPQGGRRVATYKELSAAQLMAMSPEEELDAKVDETDFGAAMCCLSILRYLTDGLTTLPMGLLSRVVATNDTLMALVPLLDQPPWVRRRPNGAFEKWMNNQWQAVEAVDRFRLSQADAQVWLTVTNLVVEPKSRAKYGFDEWRRDRLLTLKRFMNELLFDQIPVLKDLQRVLDEMALGVGSDPSTARNAALILEAVPALRDSLLAVPDWRGLALSQAQSQFSPEGSRQTARAMYESLTQSFDFMADFMADLGGLTDPTKAQSGAAHGDPLGSSGSATQSSRSKGWGPGPVRLSSWRKAHESGVMEAWSDYVFELDPTKPPEPVSLEHLQGLRYRLLPMDLESSRPLPISGKFTKFHVDLKQTEHQ